MCGSGAGNYSASTAAGDDASVQDPLLNFLVEKYGSVPEAFAALDNNLSGTVTFTEFKALLVDQIKYCGVAEAKALFRLKATDGVALHRSDFGVGEEAWKELLRSRAAKLRAMPKVKGLVVEKTGRRAKKADPEKLRAFKEFLVGKYGSPEAAFAALDTNLSGSLSLSELRAVVVDQLKYCSEKECGELFRALDADRNGGAGAGLVSYEEFGVRARDWRRLIKEKEAAAAIKGRGSTAAGNPDGVAAEALDPLDHRPFAEMLATLSRVRQHRPEEPDSSRLHSPRRASAPAAATGCRGGNSYTSARGAKVSSATGAAAGYATQRPVLDSCHHDPSFSSRGGDDSGSRRASAGDADALNGAPSLWGKSAKAGDSSAVRRGSRSILLPPLQLPLMFMEGAQTARNSKEEGTVEDMVAEMSAQHRAWWTARRRDVRREERQKRADYAAKLLREIPRRPFCSAVR